MNQEFMAQGKMQRSMGQTAISSLITWLGKARQIKGAGKRSASGKLGLLSRNIEGSLAGKNSRIDSAYANYGEIRQAQIEAERRRLVRI
jgi:hypothetical protein